MSEKGPIYGVELLGTLPLEGIALLESDPNRFQQFDASNGWGTYKDFVPWLYRYLDACKEFPEANVRALR